MLRRLKDVYSNFTHLINSQVLQPPWIVECHLQLALTVSVKLGVDFEGVIRHVLPERKQKQTIKEMNQARFN